MTPSDPFDRLRASLDRFADCGRGAAFWLRDDDAVAPTPALDRLLETCARFEIPATLAVIPLLAEPALFERIAKAGNVEIAVHGWSHRNHEPPGRKSAEFGYTRSLGDIAGELRQGIATLAEQAGTSFVPMFVPPWNRIAASVVPEVARAGFATLSVFGPENDSLPIRSVNSHVDLIDWRGSRGGRQAEDLVADIVRRLDAVWEDPGKVVGFLTHHLVHDAEAWRFLDRLFSVTHSHPGGCWVSAKGAEGLG